MPASDSRETRLHLAVAAAAVLSWAATPAAAGVQGTVVNATTGEPAAGVMLTLSSFVGGMTPLEETVSGADGAFVFQKELPPVAEGQPYAGAIRTELDGVGYTEILDSEAATEPVLVTVYSASADASLQPDNRIVILEPGEAEMIVRELYVFRNESSPPVTYSSEAGTLRFFLPDAAEGIVQVSGVGPAGMPLTSTALPTDVTGVHKVDFPLKPGESRINLAYLLPHADGSEFTLRSTYPSLATRIATPDGVNVEGEGISPLGREPSTNAPIYSVADAEPVAITVTGQGAFGSGSTATSSRPTQISIEPAPIASELAWITGLAILILGLGFAHLLTSGAPRSSEVRSGPEG